MALLLLPGPRLAASAAMVGRIGFVIGLLDQLVRVGTIGMAYVVRGGRDHQVYAEDLATQGAYAHCCNPMYFGNFSCSRASLSRASNSWLFLAVALPLVGFMYGDRRRRGGSPARQVRRPL